jgi:hypothetical protein
MVQSTPTMLSLNAIVDELIDGDTKWWKSRLLDMLFTQEEVNLIHSIPVVVTQIFY